MPVAATRNLPVSAGGAEEPRAWVFPGGAESASVSHNLNGQRLGRKGRDTRERILAAAVELLAQPEEVAPISMSTVAGKAALKMTSLYNYFTDLTELLLAVLEPVMGECEDAFVAMLRERWSDEGLGECCRAFMIAYHGFWARNSRLLHLRNAMADGRDERMMFHRVHSTQPLIRLLAAQMGDDGQDINSMSRGMATVLMTGIERSVTVATDVYLTKFFGTNNRDASFYLLNEARLIELAVRDVRQRRAGLTTT